MQEIGYNKSPNLTDQGRKLPSFENWLLQIEIEYSKEIGENERRWIGERKWREIGEGLD